MFKGLRFRLSLLYLFAALMLIALLGGGAYFLLDNYFRTIADETLQHKMAHEFVALGAPLPPELAQADASWYLQRGQLIPQIAATQPADLSLLDSYRLRQEDEASHLADEEFNSGEMAMVFVLPMDKTGQLLQSAGAATSKLKPDRAAYESALQHGKDIRTTAMGNATRVRLLTYTLQVNGETAVLQVGRDLSDQDRVLRYLMLTVLGLGAFCGVAMGLGSWWMAGRSLQPTIQAWDKQHAFVANASHELRAPLTLMRASVEMAYQQLAPDDVDNRQLLQDALNENDYMSQLVNDLLTLSRLDVGEIKLECAPTDLTQLIEELVRQVRRVADEHAIALRTNLDNVHVWADGTRLRQVLLLIIDNAIKHTPNGGSITIATAAHSKRGEITIADTGTGIAPEHVPHVFDRFYRASTQARGDVSESSGLGLALAQSLIQAQHGSIELSSALNQGTCIKILLPLSATQRAVL